MKSFLIAGAIICLSFVQVSYSSEDKLTQLNEDLKKIINNQAKYDNLSEIEIKEKVIPALLLANEKGLHQKDIFLKYSIIDSLAQKYDLYQKPFNNEDNMRIIDFYKIIYFMMGKGHLNKGEMNSILKKEKGLFEEPIKLIDDLDNDDSVEILFDLQDLQSESGVFIILDDENGEVQHIDRREEIRCKKGEYSFDKRNLLIIFHSVTDRINRGIEVINKKEAYEIWAVKECTAKFQYLRGEIKLVDGPNIKEQIVERKRIEEDKFP